MGIFTRLIRKRREEKTKESVDGILENTAKDTEAVIVDVELVEQCRRILDNPFAEHYKNVEIYVQIQAFQKMKEMVRMLNILDDKYSDQYDCSLLNDKLQDFTENKKALDVAAANLETLRVTLTQEILNFTRIVKEVGERYKLSPNWEGKKQVLIEKQKELEKRKSEYEKNERQLDDCFSALYREFEDIDRAFLELSREIMKKAEAYKK